MWRPAARGLWVGASICLGLATAYAQTALRARTDSGREVILRNDGTWVFATPAPQALPPAATGQPPAPPQSNRPATPPSQQRPSIPPLFPNAAAPQPPAPQQQGQPSAPPLRNTAARPVVRPADATTVHNTRRGSFKFWYNPAKWKPAPENPDGRIQFQLVGHEAFMVLIPEGTPLPIAQLKTVALENARQSGSDARIVSEEFRSIAGREVLQLQINVTIDATPIAFIGYYFGDPKGSVQLVGFTAQGDLARYRANILEGLDGLDLNR